MAAWPRARRAWWRSRPRWAGPWSVVRGPGPGAGHASRLPLRLGGLRPVVRWDRCRPAPCRAGGGRRRAPTSWCARWGACAGCSASPPARRRRCAPPTCGRCCRGSIRPSSSTPVTDRCCCSASPGGCAAASSSARCGRRRPSGRGPARWPAQLQDRPGGSGAQGGGRLRRRPCHLPGTGGGGVAGASGVTEGPAFRPVDRHGRLGERRLSDQSVALVVKRHMVGLGRASGHLCRHSQRRGIATTATKGRGEQARHHAQPGPHLDRDRARLHRGGRAFH